MFIIFLLEKMQIDKLIQKYFIYLKGKAALYIDKFSSFNTKFTEKPKSFKIMKIFDLLDELHKMQYLIKLIEEVYSYFLLFHIFIH